MIEREEGVHNKLAGWIAGLSPLSR